MKRIAYEGEDRYKARQVKKKYEKAKKLKGGSNILSVHMVELEVANDYIVIVDMKGDDNE